MKKNNPRALLPILVFLLLYLGLGLSFEYVLKIPMGFYNIPIVICFLIAILVACLQNPELSFDKKLEIMGQGVGDKNIVTMLLIFLVAGTFVGVVGRSSAESVAYFMLSIIPARFAVAVLFVVACFVSTAMGTSVGTIDLDMTSQSLESTGFPLDAAIQGDGFFLVGPKGLTFDSPDDFKSLTLSRVGDFKFDADGYLVDGGGNVVYGFSTCNAQLNADGTVGDIEEDPGIDGNAISTVLAPIRLPLAAVGSTDPNATIKPGAALYPGFTDGTNQNTDPTIGTNPENTTGDTINYSSLQIDENGRITCVNDDTKEPVVVGYRHRQGGEPQRPDAHGRALL